MDPTKWYEAPTQQYYSYSHFPNPSAGGDASASAPAGAHVYYGGPTPGGAVGPPGVDAQAPNSYGPHGGYAGHAAPYVYPPAAAAAAAEANYLHGFGGGDAQGLPAKDANQQYGVHPVAYVDVLGRTPTMSIYPNKAARLSKNGTIWKKKKKIPKVVQSVYCEVCKISCNSQEVLNSHRQGKKHKKNVEKLKESFSPTPAKARTTSGGKKETPEAEKGKAGGEKTKKNPALATKVDLESKKRRVLDGGAAADAVKVCSLCNVVCNSQLVFSFHIAGQKHAAMVKKQQGATVS